MLNCGLTRLSGKTRRQSGTFSQWQDGIPGIRMSKTQLMEAIRQALIAANLPAHDYVGHGFKIGAKTTAAMAGLENLAI